MSKLQCELQIQNEDFLWFDKQDTDEKISRCQEQWNLFILFYVNDLYDVAFEFGKNADFGEYDFKYHDSEWETWHCNY